MAKQQRQLCRPLDLVKALNSDFITESNCRKLYDATLARLRNVGYDGSMLEMNDLLLVLNPDGAPLLDADGLPEVRICNFEMLYRL